MPQSRSCRRHPTGTDSGKSRCNCACARDCTQGGRRESDTQPARSISALGNHDAAGARAALNERLARLEDALSDYDKATIRSDATTVLKDDVGVIRGILASYPSQKLVIEGNADERGSSEYNLALGDKRARAAEEFLTTMGIPNVQLTVISYGKDHPICTDETEACWRRTAGLTSAPPVDTIPCIPRTKRRLRREAFWASI